jgi:hypothetical protein
VPHLVVDLLCAKIDLLPQSQCSDGYFGFYVKVDDNEKERVTFETRHKDEADQWVVYCRFHSSPLLPFFLFFFFFRRHKQIFPKQCFISLSAHVLIYCIDRKARREAATSTSELLSYASPLSVSLTTLFLNPYLFLRP